MENSWSVILAELEELVVSGQHEKCRERLEALAPRNSPRAVAVELAQLASRIFHSIYALKTLHPFVVPENSFDEPATASEKLQYAHALRNLGATEEALEILQTIDTTQNPEVLFHRALCYFTQWNYPKSIPVLKEYIQTPGLDPYRVLVGEVNLVAAYVYQGEWDMALSLLSTIQESCLRSNYLLLLGNSFELQAQVFFFQKKYDEALECLKESEKYLKDQKGLYLFFVKKWAILCRCAQDFNSKNQQDLQQLRSEALELGSWDTARECDLFQGVFGDDLDLIRHVTLGTPAESYRQRVRKLCGQMIKSEGRYEWRLSGPDTTPSPSGNAEPSSEPQTLFDPKIILADKKYLLALFEKLTVDLYKPSYLGALFKGVYPEEKFNPYTSPARVMQLLKRLDQVFQQKKIPLKVNFKKSEFSLQATASIQILLRRGKKLASLDGKWSDARTAFAGRTFTALGLAEVLGVSKSSAQRMIQKALDSKKISSSGRGRSTIYFFATSVAKSPKAKSAA